MSARTYPAIEMLHRPRRLLAGVCAKLAERASVPVWLPRALFVGLLVIHTVPAILLYGGLAFFWRDARRETPPVPVRPWQSPAQRISDLEARLASLEAEALSSEAGLRRQFRDLG